MWERLKDSSLALLDIESLLLSATPPDHPDYSLRLSNIESRFERRSNALDSRAELESERLQRKFEGERDIVGRWFTEHKEKTRKDLLASLNSQLDMVKIEMKILQEFERQGKSFPPGESDEDSDEEGPKKVERTAEDDDDSGYAKPPWEVQSVGSVSNVDEDSAGSDAENGTRSFSFSFHHPLTTTDSSAALEISERPSRKARHLMDPLLPISALDASTDMALISSLAQKQPYGQSALANPDVFLMLRKLEGIVGRIPALGEAWDNDDPDKVEEMIESVVQEMERRELEYVQRLFEGKAQVADDVDRGMESERSATPEPVEGLDLGRWAVDVDGKDGTTNLKRKREDIVEATA